MEIYLMEQRSEEALPKSLSLSLRELLPAALFFTALIEVKFFVVLTHTHTCLFLPSFFFKVQQEVDLIISALCPGPVQRAPSLSSKTRFLTAQ